MKTVQQAEDFIRKIGMKPERKVKHAGWDILISDGYVPPETNLRKHYENRRAIEPDEFPMGFYVTTPIIAREDEVVAMPVLFCEAFHDAGVLDTATKKVARVNSAQIAAEKIIEDFNSGDGNA